MITPKRTNTSCGNKRKTQINEGGKKIIKINKQTNKQKNAQVIKAKRIDTAGRTVRLTSR